MKRTLLSFLLGALAFVGALPALAQAEPIGVAAYVYCDSIEVQATSRYPISATATVRVTFLDETTLFEGGVFEVKPGTASRATFDYPKQPAKTPLKYFVDIVSEAGVVTRQGTMAFCIDYDAPKLNSADFPPPVAVYCTETGGVNVVRVANGVGVESAIATPAQIAQALLNAQASGQNAQVLGTASGMGLFALTSGELQATLRGTQNYDYVFPITFCGGINTASLTPNPAPQVAPPVPVVTVPSVSVGGTCTPRTGARFAHVVGRGQNLFRIGLSYGVPFQTIAQFNGINPNIIYVGQCIQIP